MQNKKKKNKQNIFLLMLLLINIHAQYERNTQTFGYLLSVLLKDVKINEKGNLTELLNISAGLQIG